MTNARLRLRMDCKLVPGSRVSRYRVLVNQYTVGMLYINRDTKECWYDKYVLDKNRHPMVAHGLTGGNNLRYCWEYTKSQKWFDGNGRQVYG